jgi:abequosyltransferase
MKKPVLSICIPVHNFDRFVGQTLDSILIQPEASEVEIVVIDGASTDKTPEVMASYCERFSNVKYHRLPKKGGIDRDMSKSVEIASGTYCWLFSGDDIMSADSLKAVIDRLRFGHEVYLCRHYNGTFDLDRINLHPVLGIDGERVFDFSVAEDRREYFGSALTTEAYFSFMSGIIVKRDFWCSISIDEKYFSTCWALAARLLTRVSEGFRVVYISEPLLTRRGDNDSFLINGVVRRFGLSINGYLMIVADLFGAASHEYSNVKKVLRNEFSLSAFIFAKRKCYLSPELENYSLLCELFDKIYENSGAVSFAKKLVFRTFPVWLHPVLRPVWRGIKFLRVGRVFN